MAEGGFWSNYGDDVINAALAYWMAQQQQKTPNQYPVQLTPEQKWQFEEGKKLYEYSPMRDYVGRASHSFLSGFNPNPTGFQWNSPRMQGQTFAGGVQMPRFDTSGPQYWRQDYKAPNATPTTQAPTSNQGTGTGSGPMMEYTDAFNPKYDGHAPRNRTMGPGDSSVGAYLGGGGPGSGPMDPNSPQAREAWGKINEALNNLKVTNPGLVRAGGNALAAALTAMTGLPGAIIGMFIKYWAGRPATPNPQPARTGDLGAQDASGIPPYRP